MGYVKVEIREQLALIKLNRPEVHNALSWELLDELRQAFARLREQAGIRCLVLGGEGPSFASGGDIRQMGAISGPQEAAERAAWCQEVFQEIESHPQPVISAIHGHCLGGGCELALATDIRVAHREARLGLPHVKMGIPPGYGATYRLPRIVGLGAAKYLVLTGAVVDGLTALRLGLVDLLTGGDVVEAALEVARTIASRAPVAVSLAKQALNEAARTSADCARESALFQRAFDTQDRLEAVAAFVEKRLPLFAGS